MSSDLTVKDVGAVIRPATEAVPTQTGAQAGKGYVKLSINADSTRKFSISQHYDSDFEDGGFTLADVLAPNTNYKLYLFTPSTIDLGQTKIKGGEIQGDSIEIPFTTASLPAVGDAVWSGALGTTADVINLKEYHFMQAQTGVIVTYFQIAKPTFLQEFSSRKSEDTPIYETRASYTPSGGAFPRTNIYYNYGGITGYTFDYFYFIASEKLPILKIGFQSTHTDRDGDSTSFVVPISRY
ncbi:hypothetical protein P0082_09695 [Candidatus Haliotispira prima]|uniref:Uncharacterized protein n=1 Tax=Candidatus Haliotispira prima TaxID=3034016 RepID=A0ABY8MFR1_9SPIO|nr:hypothetical protein P0082_09695 [Candidatus Haliotispira prima]